MESIAKRISIRRKELGITQKELAEKLFVSDKTVSRWETGKQIPDALMMQNIASALDMSVAELYGGENTQKGVKHKSIPFEKIRKIFGFGVLAASLIVVIGLWSMNRELNSRVSCQIGEFPMYMLSGQDHSVVEWVEQCSTAGAELGHLSALSGETAYYLFYLPRGCETTELEYSYRYSLRGPVLQLNFKKLSGQVDDKHYLCYMKFPCEDSFILKTYIEGKAVEPCSDIANFMSLCEMIFNE